jgi:putative PIN family toxin of toxin-antitoxin system
MASTLRVVVDTNVLLSGIAFPGSIPGKIIAAWRHGSVEVLLSEFILDELRRVLPRLAHRHGLSAAEIDDLADILAIQAELVAPLPATDPALRDANDRPVLGTLLAALHHGSAECLITGDKDLLVLGDSFPILSPAEFWARHGSL